MNPTKPAPSREFYWENILALLFVHLAALSGIAYVVWVRFSPWSVGLALVTLLLCMLTTTAGYHRLFSHRSYKARWPVRFFYLLVGSAAGQASVLRWAADHRLHHAMTDRDEDPYNVTKGFWWAHMGWMLFRSPTDPEMVRDLERDPLVRLQDRFYFILFMAMALLLPTLLGSIWGDALGALLLAGFLRLVVQWHLTFSINSVAHSYGRRPYTDKVTARDSLIAAFLTMGEGYHNYHHRFPSDYRNGVRFFHFDPTKWWIWILSRIGLARDLRRAPVEQIARARSGAR